MKNIALRFKKVRETKAMTQVEFAKTLDTSQRNISCYENGKLEIPDKIKIELFKFGINMNWFLTGEGEMYFKSISCYLKQDINQDNVIDSLGDGVIMLTKIHAAKNRTHYDNTIKYLKRTADIVEMEEGGKISGDD